MKSEAEARKFSSEALMVLRPAPEKKVLQFRLFLFQKSNFFNFYDFELFLEAKVFFRKRLFCRWRQFFFAHLEIFGQKMLRNFRFRILGFQKFQISEFTPVEIFQD